MSPPSGWAICRTTALAIATLELPLGSRIADVSLHELYLPVEWGETLGESGREVVDDRYRVAAVEQRADEVVADEPSTARHQRMHRFSFAAAEAKFRDLIRGDQTQSETIRSDFTERSAFLVSSTTPTCPARVA